jgi:DNA modification methylase
MGTKKLTNVERNLEIYSTQEIPTDASKVDHDTPLKDLNLNWSERDLPEKIRTKHVHRLHPYLGKFIPQLVEVFLRKYFSPNDTILDPFAGSSTTLVQANELGINSIGYDISAFNILLGKVKTADYDIPVLSQEINDILEKCIHICNNINFHTQQELFGIEEVDPLRSDDEYLSEWFSPLALNQLLAYRELIQNSDYKYSDVMKVILSRSARSARLTTHFDLDFPKKPQKEPYYCYKHRRTCTPVTDALQFIKRYSIDTKKRISEFSSLRTNASVQLIHQDSRIANIPPIDGAITSPPYVGLIDYHEQHEYAYHLLNLDDKRKSEIGAGVNGSGIKAKVDYQNDISSVFRNVMSALKPGGRLIVVAGDRANLYPTICDDLGFEVEAVVQRHVNRRTGRRASDFFESIFIWRKPV